MTEVEHVAAAAACAHQDVLGSCLHQLPGPEQRNRIEIALHASVETDAGPGAVELHPSVETDHVPTGIAHVCEQTRRPGPEVDRRHRDRAEHPSRVRGRELLIVSRREDSGPRVEQLNHVGPRLCLGRDIARKRRREPLHQRVPDGRLPVHELLRPPEVATPASLDEIAADRERPAAKADERLFVWKLLANDPDRLENVNERLGRIGNTKQPHVFEGAQRRIDHRSDALHELDGHAHPEHGRDDVGKEHRGIDVVSPNRLERHLGAELRRLGDLEEAVPLAQCPVLGKRTPRLAHEPDRGALDDLAPAGADKEGLGHGAYTSPVPGPLVARWLSWSLDLPRAGALTMARAEVENIGAATWGTDIAASYHWLDERDNAIVWDGIRTPLPTTVSPGARAELGISVRAPIPPGHYRFALDLVAEHRAWFGELGGEAPQAEVEVVPRIDTRSLRDIAVVHAPDSTSEWDRRVLELHAEGYGVVAGAVDGPRRSRRALAPWAPGPGRVPGFSHALLCPSVLHGIDLERLADIEGLPAFRPPADEPWVYDASLVLSLA